jgi:hypothetical protein
MKANEALYNLIPSASVADKIELHNIVQVTFNVFTPGPSKVGKCFCT